MPLHPPHAQAPPASRAQPHAVVARVPVARLEGLPLDASPRDVSSPGSPPLESPPRDDEVLVLRDVVKGWFHGDPRAPSARPVLRGATLVVSRGETVVVLAAPGAGATTLLLVMAGLARPDGGEVRRYGLDGGGNSVRLVPTSPALPPAWTPRDVVAAAIPPRWPTPFAAAAIGRALREAGLTPVADAPLRRLPPAAAWNSALAAARLASPRLLLVDRPPDPAAVVAWPVRLVAAVAEPGAASGATVLVLPPGSPPPPWARVARLEHGCLHEGQESAAGFVESATGAS